MPEFEHPHLAHRLLHAVGMRVIRRDAIASLAALCLALLACRFGDGRWHIDLPRDECADDTPRAPQPPPSACATLSGTPEEVIGTDDGWLLARFSDTSAFSNPDGGQFLERAPVTVETELLSPDATLLTRSAVALGERTIFSGLTGYRAASFALVGNVLIGAIGRDLVAVDSRGAGPSFRDLASDVPDAVRLVALDSTRVAAFGIDRLKYGAPATPMVRIYDAVSGATVSNRVYDFGAAATAYPADFLNLGTPVPALAVVRIDAGRLLVAWVAENRRAIEAMLVDANGEPLGEPTALTTAGTDLYPPRLARISDTELGMVWTGNSGLEVRYRSLAVDLAGVRPENGVVVNATTRCSQEYARIASAPGGGALVVWGTETPGPVRGRWIGAGAPVTLDPPGSDLSPSPSCSVDSRAATLASGPHGLLLAWHEAGFTGAESTMVTTVSR